MLIPAPGVAGQFAAPCWLHSAAEFFADMHRVLRYASLGPVKSFCHHRLMLLVRHSTLRLCSNTCCLHMRCCYHALG